MNFLSNVLDAVPVVGHVKGIVHYAVGDKDGGNRAMYQATRTSAVIAGGVAGGVVGGPAGAVGGAMYAGCVTDIGASAAMSKDQGIIRHCKNVNEDIKSGKNPTTSLIFTGVHLGLDAVGGLGMGGVTSATANTVGKKLASKVGEEIIEKSVKITAEEVAMLTVRKASEKIVKKAIENTAEKVIIQAATTVERALLETIMKEEQEHKSTEQKKAERQATKKQNNEQKEKKNQKREKEEKTFKETGTGSGSKPPNENRGNKKNDVCDNTSDFSDFLKLLKEILATLRGKKNQEKFYEVFQRLLPGQKKYLVKLIKKLNYSGAFKEVLKLVIQIFDLYFPSDFTFENFLSMTEFIKTYINNKIEENSMVSLGNETTPSTVPFKQLVAYLLTVVASDFDILKKIITIFKDIRAEIESEITKETVDPNFRDIFSAVYHYFKHRSVPDDGTLLVKQYYDWIRHLLGKVKQLPEWPDLGDRRNRRNVIIYELYVDAFGRRIRIVLKFQGDRIVLSSCYIVCNSFSDDEEGDEFIDGLRRSM